MEEKKLEAIGAVEHAQTPPAIRQTPAVARKSYKVDGRDRLLLPLAWGLGVLFVEMLGTCLLNETGGGLVVPVLVAAWYGVLFWYRGFEGFTQRPSLLLFGAVCLLALQFALYAEVWFRYWNLLALPLLMMVQLYQWSGAGRKPWWRAGMLFERAGLLLDGIFWRMDAWLQTLRSCRDLSGRRRGLAVLLGLAASLLALLAAVPALLNADALFRYVTGDALQWLLQNFSHWFWRLGLGLLFMPFLFGLLYDLRHPVQGKERTASAFSVDPVIPFTVLLVMDALYLFFVGVQAAALFGGPDYLAAAGISYADYARSGFFQLVFVAALNLALVLLCLQFCRREGRGGKGVRMLATVLVALSVVVLLSAAWRMTLYVRSYGLSLKRFLTYWGMGMLAIFFVAAFLKIWKQDFSFFRVLFTAGVAGWLVLNLMNVDALVVRYNQAAGIEDTAYLYQLSVDALPAIEALAESRPEERDLMSVVERLRARAIADASRWQTWSVSAQIAAVK